MRRPLLLTLAVVGSLVVLIGGTGLFAALTDTARTGTNQVDSAPLAASADIQLATATNSGSAITCGTFDHNLSTGFFTVADVGPGYASSVAYYCIKNVGSQTVSLSASVEELVDTDTSCTGDEELHGDTTCGGGLLGELSMVLDVGYAPYVCATGTTPGGTGVWLMDNVALPVPISGGLAAGAVGCFAVGISYPASVTATNVQKAQSDRVTWRFKFSAQA